MDSCCKFKCTNSSNTIASPTVNTTYSVSVIDANGCSANTNTTQITVNSTPTISATSGSICLGQTFTTTAIGATTYTWSTGAISPSIAVTPTTTTIYTVTGSVGTCSASVNSTITVQPTPTITVNSGSICLGQTFTTTANGASTYAWNTGATTSSIAVTPTTTTVYTVTGSVGTCSASVNSTITVQPTPTITVNSGSICLGQTFTISASGADTYTWNTSQNSSSIVVSPTVTTSYSVIGTNTLGCEASSNSTINIISSKQISGITTFTIGSVTGEVTLYKYSPILSMWDSVATVNFNPGFNFGQQDSASYVIRAIPSATNIQTTYGNSSINWQNATILNHGCTANSSQTITLIPFENIGTGSGVLVGTVVEGIGFGQKPSNGTSTMAPLAPGNPIGGIIVKGGKNPGGNMFTQTETDASGTYTITGIPNTAPGESIFVFIDIPGLDTSGTYCRTFVNGESYTGLNFVVDSAKIRPVNPNQCLDVRISENSIENSLNVYPNPANDKFTIKFSALSDSDTKIELVDVIGRKVDSIFNNKTFKSDKYEFDVNTKDINSGIYFLKIDIDGNIQTIKMIITH